MFSLRRLLIGLAAGALFVAAGHCQEDPMEEMVAEALAVTVNETGDKWLEMVKARPDDPDEQVFADWLMARPDIESAVVAGDAIEAKTTDGITVRFCDYQPGVHGAGGLALGAGVMPVLQAVPGKLRCIGEVVPGTKALIIDTDGGIIDDPNRDIQRMLERANYTVVERRGGAAAFLEMKDAAVTIVDSHGGVDPDGEHFAVVADIQRSTNVSNLAHWYHWLANGNAVLERAVIRDKVTKLPVAVTTNLSLYDTWFDAYIPSLPNNAAVFFYTCDSMTLDTGMWPILKKKGASFYFGFSGSVADPWGIDWVKRYLEQLTAAQIYAPWDTNPPRRAQSFEDAFKYIVKRPQYLIGPRAGAIPNYNTYYEDASYSMVPHIDQAQVAPVPEGEPNYEVMLYGALGRADESKVYCGGQPAQFTGISGGNGAPFRALIPLGTTGPIVVNDKWGRQSNMVMLSRFTGEVEFKYDDPEKAGTVKLTYSSLVIGTRLRRLQDPELRFAGVPELASIPGMSTQALAQLSAQMEQAGFALMDGSGDWIVEWDFHSVKRIGAATVTARGQGEAHGRGGAHDDDSPDGFVTVLLKPVQDDASAITCQAEVCAGATAGPITVTYDSPAGRTTVQKMVICAGVPQTCTYDLINSSLPRVNGAAGFGNWKLEPVTITPNPYDMDAPAWLPDELRDAGRLAGLDHLFASPSRG